jgi:3(or 17)beta-hydroxysteroid dehydrogenase
MNQLKSKVAIITGGGSGIGAATAERIAEQGASVMITDINGSAAEQTARVIQQRGQAAQALAQDVADPDAWATVFTETAKAFGPANVLVNNAGVSGAGQDRFEEPEGLDAWRQIMSINLDAVNLGCRIAIQEMKVSGGTIVNISSVMGLVGGAGPAYNASKGGVRLLTKSIASYCGRMGYPIRCNSVHPGYIWTPMVRQIAEVHEEVSTEAELKEMLLLQHPIGRLGEADDIANGIRFLVSDESSFMTGSELVIDGGYTCV